MKHSDVWRWMVVIGMALLAGCRQTAELGETSWALVAYGPVDVPLDAEAPASISFEDNGRMGGNTGCNAFSGNYEAEDGRLLLSDEIAYTAKGCGTDSPEATQEAFFRSRLGDSITYTQTTDRLVLFFNDGQQVAEYRLSDE